MLDDGEEEVVQQGPVHVHRLKQGKSVTIGPSGWALSQQAPATVSHTPKSKPKYTTQQLSENGKSCSTYYWSQDSQQVLLSVPVPARTKAKAVKVDIEEKQLTISLDGQQLIGGETAMPIDAEHDYTDWELVDWEEGDAGRRLLRVTLKKKVPHELQVVLWWPKLLASETDVVDPAAISGRKAGADSFKETWEAAHEQFKEKVQSIQPTEVVDVVDE